MRAFLLFAIAALPTAAACSSGAPAAGASSDAGVNLDSAPDSDSAAANNGDDAEVDTPVLDDADDGAASDMIGAIDAPSADAPDAVDASEDTTPAGPARTVGALYCPPPGTAFPATPLPAGAPSPTPIAFSPPDGITFLEGPVWLADPGVLLFSEFTGQHRILRLTPPDAVDVFFADSGTNGLALAPDGTALLMVTAAQTNTVSRLDLADKTVQPVAAAYNGQGFMQPNDLVVRADGTIFFTDYQAGRLYRRGLDGTVALLSSLPLSNGVGLSPDETTLYLNADSRTVKYPLAADSTIGDAADLATGLHGADGIAVDCAGDVFIAQNTGGSLVVMSAAGQKLGEIGGLPMVVTNAAFGGADRQTLYITTSSALYSIPLQIPGLPY